MPSRLRVGVMSDLHLEFEPAHMERLRQCARGDSSMLAAALRRSRDLAREPGHPGTGPDLRRLKAEGIDLLVLAGDIDVGARGIGYAFGAARYLGCPAVYVAGNREHYGCDMLEILSRLRSAAVATGGAVLFLENDRVDLHLRGRRIAVLGCTLWTDMRLTGDATTAMRHASVELSDFRLVRYGRRPFTPATAQALHLESRAWLAREAPRARTAADLVIIVTHHGPVPDANPPSIGAGRDRRLATGPDGLGAHASFHDGGDRSDAAAVSPAWLCRRRGRRRCVRAAGGQHLMTHGVRCRAWRYRLL